MREIKPEDLVGKTITEINTECVNVLHLTFSDGTHFSIWAETGSCSIPHLLTDDSCQGVLPEKGQ